MSWFQPPVQRGPGPLETLMGWMFAGLFMLVAVSVAIDVAVRFVVPLLPWLGGIILLTLAARFWMHRESQWY